MVYRSVRMDVGEPAIWFSSAQTAAGAYRDPVPATSCSRDVLHHSGIQPWTVGIHGDMEYTMHFLTLNCK